MSPVPVALDGAAVTGVTAGGGHTCATTDDDRALCWGRGLNGELGTGRIEETPTPREFGRGFYDVRVVTAGLHHTCGIDVDGVVLCSGWNVYGQLGINATVNLGGPERIVSSDRFAAITAGRHHTCALTTDERAFCWGRGDLGQLGTGTLTTSLVPVAVAGGYRFTMLSAGAEHTCALTVQGAAFCWGHNQYGRAGQLAEIAIAEPAAAAGELRFRMISAGFGHTCGVALDGRAYCWGFGAFGQLGSGGTASGPRPVLVTAPAPMDR
jgi:alpha-tubulin suppressor-like RCC1 family protein